MWLGGRGRRRRRLAGLRSLGRTRPLSTHRQRAHRTTPRGGRDARSGEAPSGGRARGRLGRAVSWGGRSSGSAASTTERDANEVVDERDSSVENASVTPPRSPRCRARKRACRFFPDARPSSERPYSWLAMRCSPRRWQAAQLSQRAPTEAHLPQKTFIAPQPLHRPNRPSTRGRLSRSGWTRDAFDGTVDHGGCVCSTRSPRRPGCSDPGLHLLRLAHPTPSTPSTAMTLPNEQSNGTSSESRGRRLAATARAFRRQTWRQGARLHPRRGYAASKPAFRGVSRPRSRCRDVSGVHSPVRDVRPGFRAPLRHRSCLDVPSIRRRDLRGVDGIGLASSVNRICTRADASDASVRAVALRRRLGWSHVRR